jgi:DNA-binding response OmpR family regulator
MNRAHILIVEDDALLRDCIKNYILQHGHICSCASDGSEAIRWLGRNTCDVVLTDIRMPEVDGLTLAKLIREKHPLLPILISTGLGYDEELMQTALRAGANGYMSKAMGPKALLVKLLEIAGQRTRHASLIAA